MNRTTNKIESRILPANDVAAANDGKRVQIMLIFDNHPPSLRLIREVF